jgi:[ribosomal protein S5]-alanine N-acetyltransferase
MSDAAERENSLLFDLPDLETERLRLRRLRPEDASDMFVYASKAHVSRYITWEAHKSEDDSLEFINRIIKLDYNNPQTGHWTWGLELRATGRLIGTFVVFGEIQHRCMEIGYVIDDLYWGQGLVPEAASAVIRLGFEQLGLNRIQASHIIGNDASGRVLEKVGMTYEGTLREVFLIKGAFWTMKMYSILRREYHERQA